MTKRRLRKHPDTNRARFERQAESDGELAASHKTKVRFDGSYMAVCSCAWVGVRRDSRGTAEADAEMHRTAVD